MWYYKWIIIVIILILIIIGLLIACNRTLEVNEYHIDADAVDNPIRFAVLTDLHASKYGKDMCQLIDAVEQIHPDAILMVGDIFDREEKNDNAWSLITSLTQRYPCYYVTGNHEISNDALTQIIAQLQEYGVRVLSGTSDTILLHNQHIRICGVDDASSSDFMSQLHSISIEPTDADYHILLSHRPDLITLYAETKADLVIAGHAHGGQWRLPYIAPNGLYAPHQGWFPKYTSGLHQVDNTTLLVSRGLDKRSVKLPRIFNRPELAVIIIA